MPYETEIVDGGRGLIHRGHGVVTLEEILSAIDRTRQNTELIRSMRYALVDWTEVAELQATDANVRRTVDADRPVARLSPGLPVALVAPSDYLFGISRMWQAHVTALGWHAVVFRDRPSADAWLRPYRLAAGEGGTK